MCELTRRDCRFAEARAILALDPENAMAKAVLAKDATPGPRDEP